jgi:hypothetical protein
MPNRAAYNTLQANTCTDPVVGAILAGWRYDISNIAPGMRTDYEDHLAECPHCSRRQTLARATDVLLISVSSLSILAFLLAAVVIRRVELLTHIGIIHAHLRHTAIAISLEWVAIAGLVFSMVLWLLVAIATPLPGFLTSIVQQKLPPDVRQRFTRRAA